MQWYAPLIEKIEQTYSDLEIVSDGDDLGQDPAVRQALEKSFVLHDYRGELFLRAFLDERDSQQRVAILKPADAVYIPFDVENSACTVTWSLKEIFPKLDTGVLKEFSSRHYQKIYESYITIKDSLGEAGAGETLYLICQWLFGVNLAEVDNINRAVVLIAAAYHAEEHLPPSLVDYLKDKKVGLPEEAWVNRDTFYQWLSNQWEMYLDSLADSSNKASVDFSKTYLREIVAGLFMEGLLEPCPQPKYESFPEILTANPWLQVGLVMEKSPPVEEKCPGAFGRDK